MTRSISCFFTIQVYLTQSLQCPQPIYGPMETEPFPGVQHAGRAFPAFVSYPTTENGPDR